MFNMPTQDETTTPVERTIEEEEGEEERRSTRTFFALAIDDQVQFLHQTIQLGADERRIVLQFGVFRQRLKVLIVKRIVQIQFEHR